MYLQMNLLDLLSAISSPVSESGAMPSAALGGTTTDQCGRDPVLASLSPMQAKEQGLLTSGTCGQRGSISSESAALELSLVNRLHHRLDSRGSTLYDLIWKRRTTPLHRPIYALRALEHHTDASGFTSWPTPTTRDWKDSENMSTEGADGRNRLDQLPRLALLTTYAAAGPALVTNLESTDAPTVAETIQRDSLTGWPTPQAIDGAGYGRLGRFKRDIKRNPKRPGSYRVDLKDTVLKVGWATPTARDGTRGNQPSRPTDTGVPMEQMAELAQTSCPARLKATGEMLIGSDAGMEGGGQLRPGHSRWLQALPPVWDEMVPWKSNRARYLFAVTGTH